MTVLTPTRLFSAGTGTTKPSYSSPRYDHSSPKVQTICLHPARLAGGGIRDKTDAFCFPLIRSFVRRVAIRWAM